MNITILNIIFSNSIPIPIIIIIRHHLTILCTIVGRILQLWDKDEVGEEEEVVEEDIAKMDTTKRMKKSGRKRKSKSLMERIHHNLPTLKAKLKM